MERFTDEYIISLINKYREFLITDLERNICLDCYNMVKKRNLTENNVELKYSVCKLCNKHKPCIKYLK